MTGAGKPAHPEPEASTHSRQTCRASLLLIPSPPSPTENPPGLALLPRAGVCPAALPGKAHAPPGPVPLSCEEVVGPAQQGGVKRGRQPRSPLAGSHDVQRLSHACSVLPRTNFCRRLLQSHSGALIHTWGRLSGCFCRHLLARAALHSSWQPVLRPCHLTWLPSWDGQKPSARSCARAPGGFLPPAGTLGSRDCISRRPGPLVHHPLPA